MCILDCTKISYSTGFYDVFNNLLCWCKYGYIINKQISFYCTNYCVDQKL